MLDSLKQRSTELSFNQNKVNICSGEQSLKCTKGRGLMHKLLTTHTTLRFKKGEIIYCVCITKSQQKIGQTKLKKKSKTQAFIFFLHKHLQQTLRTTRRVFLSSFTPSSLRPPPLLLRLGCTKRYYTCRNQNKCLIINMSLLQESGFRFLFLK